VLCWAFAFDLLPTPPTRSHPPSEPSNALVQHPRCSCGCGPETPVDSP